jgi:hypothetical protein
MLEWADGKVCDLVLKRIEKEKGKRKKREKLEELTT